MLHFQPAQFAIVEASTCAFIAYTKSAAACGQVMTPSSTPVSPGSNNGVAVGTLENFGFLGAGAALVLLTSMAYSMGNARGYFNPVKRMFGGRGRSGGSQHLGDTSTPLAYGASAE